MRYASALHRGHYHTLNCEDALFASPFNKKTWLFAVMDGCTNATESHFASALIVKLLRQCCNEEQFKCMYNHYIPPSVNAIQKQVLQHLHTGCRTIKNSLLLNKTEFMTTLLLLVADTEKREGVITAIGDGVISINGKVTTFEQNDQPDYIGYHLEEPFELFYSSLRQTLHIPVCKDIGIATDGLHLFKSPCSLPHTDVVLEVFHSEPQPDNIFLNRKIKALEEKHGLIPTDDVAVIRVIFSD
ncbi:MAG: protein phosphatase 2C domain-containing protein [Sediminibacterium sp.]|nr:protein phosphatase 2C domain-containing protein [Sediminibacterium sp.]